MKDQKFIEELEANITGAKDLVLSYLVTGFYLIFSPGKIVQLFSEEERDSNVLYPHLFLTISAIAFGFLESNWSKDIIAGLADVEFTLTAFITDTLSVFLIALATALLIRLAFWEVDSKARHAIVALNYYVIGFFGLGAMAFTVVSAFLFRTAGDNRLASIQTPALVIAILFSR